MTRFGNLHGAQGLVDTIEVSLNRPGGQITFVAQQTNLGLCYAAAIEPGVPAARPAQVASKPNEWHIWRLTAQNREQLSARLSAIAEQPWSQAHSQSATEFRQSDGWRAALVASPDDYASKARLLAAQVGNHQASLPLSEQGLLWSEPTQRRGKVAWLFPGQGSQYPNMLRDWLAMDPTARATLDECDRAMAELGQPSFAQLAWSDDSQLGEDVWHTQAAMLIANTLIMRWLQTHGLRPDVVAGHSFGEFAAMLAAGCWDVRTALQATWHRCRAIVEHVPAACGMLSIQAPPETVQQMIDSSRIAVTISHRNAPEQTVVGGKHAAVAQFAQIVDSEGLACRLLAVPTAFHTPALAAAQEPFARSLQSIAIEAPRWPLLSSVNTQYASDPTQMRAQLARQLVTPLDYVALVERLIEMV